MLTVYLQRQNAFVFTGLNAPKLFKWIGMGMGIGMEISVKPYFKSTGANNPATLWNCCTISYTISYTIYYIKLTFIANVAVVGVLAGALIC